MGLLVTPQQFETIVLSTTPNKNLVELVESKGLYYEKLVEITERKFKQVRGVTLTNVDDFLFQYVQHLKNDDTYSLIQFIENYVD
jgi:hypothetical protein